MNSEPIWHPIPSRTFPWIFLRQTFVLSRIPVEARLRCAASGLYSVYLNGVLVGRGRAPSLTPVPVWERFAIGEFLRLGENRLLVAADGTTRPEGRAWFRAEGEILGEDGSRVELKTGSTWEVLTAGTYQVFEEGPLCGVYFAAQEPMAWQEGRFQEDAWETAVVVAGEEPREWNPRPAVEVEVWARAVIAFGEVDSHSPLSFAESLGPMVACKCVHPEALLQPGKQETLVQTRDPSRAVHLALDFGHLIAGYPRLRLRARGSGAVDLGFARQSGRIDRGLRYVAAEGRCEWLGSRLESCRYLVLRLSHFSEEVQIDSVSLVEHRASVLTRGTFAAANPFGQIWEVGQKSVDACRQEVYALLPGLARYDWLRAYLFALDDFYLTGDFQTAAAMLDSSRPPVPAREGVVPTLAYGLFVEAYYWHSGDRERVASLLPDFLQGLEAWGELAEKDGGLRTAVALNALYAGVLQGAGRLCRALRQRASQTRCAQLHQQVCARLQAAWDEERGAFADGLGDGREFSQWTNALILYFGLAREDQEARIAAQLKGPEVRRMDTLLQAFFLAGGLWRAGFDEQALQVVEEYWGGLVAREGLTWSEKRQSASLEAEPGPEFLLGSQILGVAPLTPGGGILELRPRLSGLRWAKGELSTRRGLLRVEWRRGKEQPCFVLRFDSAIEGEFHLAVPRLGRRFPTLILNGETVWRNEKIHPNPFVHQVISETERVVLVLRRPGQYEVAVE